jgi:hypothetical protein
METTAKIATANITTALIGDAQITNAKINDLSADKINAGTISADRIGANAITAAKINTTDLVLPASGGETTVSFTGTNSLQNKFIASVGSGAGFYIGYVALRGLTNHTKSMRLYFIDSAATSGASSSNMIDTSTTTGSGDFNQPLAGKGSTAYSYAVYPTPQAVPTSANSGNTWGLAPEDYDFASILNSGTRLFSGMQTLNMNFAFSYTGSNSVNLFFRGQADSATDQAVVTVSFIKFTSPS